MTKTGLGRSCGSQSTLPEFQRIFNVGDLLFYSAGSAAAEVEFRGVRDPASVRDLVDQAMDSQTGAD